MTHYLERSRGVLVSLRSSHPHSADSDPGNQPLLHAPRKRNFWSRALHFKKTWSTQFQGSWLTQPLLWVEVFFRLWKVYSATMGSCISNISIVKEIDRLAPLFSQLENCSILKVSLQSFSIHSLRQFFLWASFPGSKRSWVASLFALNAPELNTSHSILKIMIKKNKLFCISCSFGKKRFFV